MHCAQCTGRRRGDALSRAASSRVEPNDGLSLYLWPSDAFQATRLGRHFLFHFSSRALIAIASLFVNHVPCSPLHLQTPSSCLVHRLRCDTPRSRRSPINHDEHQGVAHRRKPQHCTSARVSRLILHYHAAYCGLALKNGFKTVEGATRSSSC